MNYKHHGTPPPPPPPEKGIKMEELYYVINLSVDDIGMFTYTKEELEKELADMKRDYEDDELPYRFVEAKDIPKEIYDFNEFGGDWGKTNWIIIKGEVITPKPVEVVTKYEI